MSGIEDEEERELVKEQLLAQKQIEVKFSLASVEVELCQSTDAGIDQIIAKVCCIYYLFARICLTFHLAQIGRALTGSRKTDVQFTW